MPLKCSGDFEFLRRRRANKKLCCSGIVMSAKVEMCARFVEAPTFALFIWDGEHGTHCQAVLNRAPFEGKDGLAHQVMWLCRDGQAQPSVIKNAENSVGNRQQEGLFVVLKEQAIRWNLLHDGSICFPT